MTQHDLWWVIYCADQHHRSDIQPVTRLEFLPPKFNRPSVICRACAKLVPLRSGRVEAYDRVTRKALTEEELKAHWSP
jgi:hypothetical protein